MDSTTPPTQKPGPKGRVLEPYAAEVLQRARDGQSMQDIVNWLAQPPREVSITRQAVHLWVKARIRKLVKLNAAFAGTGVGAPFQTTTASGAVQSAAVASPTTASARAETSSGSGSPKRDMRAPAALIEPEASIGQPIPQQSSRQRVDLSEFHVDESALLRAQNPLLPDS